MSEMNILAELLKGSSSATPEMKIPALDLSEEAYIQMQIDNYNSMKKSASEDYDCPECFNREYFATKNADGQFALRPCRCRTIRQTKRAAKYSGFGEMIGRYTFDSYETPEDWQKRVKLTAMRYVEQETLPWLYIGGQSGAGKSHICTAVGTYLLEHGRTVKYVLWRDVFHRFESYRYDDVKYYQYLDELLKIDVLVIDDFLKNLDEKTKSSALDIAFDIINRRYNGNNATIISSEIMLTDLEHYDIALHGRIKERCGAFTLSIKDDDTRNYRKKEKRI